ncbi:MAG: hypothetical protein RL308_1866 [Bacteroidota bacterium]|jgi:hypothetical protein
MKNKLKKRTSNRYYPIRTCKKPDCNEGFIPTDARQIYCSEQQRIDFNNDRRKLKESIDISFLKIVKKIELFCIKLLLVISTLIVDSLICHC